MTRDQITTKAQQREAIRERARRALRDLPHLYADGGHESVDLGAGYSARIKLECDESMGEPWKEHDGHGVVSEWTTRAKNPGERILCEDRSSRRYYDFAATVKLARKDGWGSTGDEGLSKGAKAARAVERDYEFLRAWCNDEWHWIGVCVDLLHGADVVQSDSLWGVESSGDYWRDVALDCLHECLAAEQKARKLAREQAREDARRSSLIRCFC